MCTYIYITWFHGDTSCEFFRYSAYFLRIVFPVISNCVATVDQHEKKRITTWTHTHTHLFETTSFLAAHCQLSITTVCTVCFLKSERDFLSYIYSRLCQIRVAFFFFFVQADAKTHCIILLECWRCFYYLWLRIWAWNRTLTSRSTELQ